MFADQAVSLSVLARNKQISCFAGGQCCHTTCFIDPVRGAEHGTSLPPYERKSPVRPGEKK